MLNIGERIRAFRQQRGLSQGDIEQRTGLLRCYLSRVENGHTVPSLQTLARIATALEIPLAEFFVESGAPAINGLPQLSDDAVAFLTQMRQFATSLNEQDREQVLSMVKKLVQGLDDSAPASS